MIQAWGRSLRVKNVYEIARKSSEILSLLYSTSESCQKCNKNARLNFDISR
jgi:hypothetical protein